MSEKQQTGEVNEVSIFDILDGSVKERTEYELTRVIQNCRDLNTDAKKARELNLKFTIVPSEDRGAASIDFSVKSKLVPIKSVDGTLLLGGTEENPIVMEYSRQLSGQRRIDGSEQDEPKVIKLADAKQA